MSGATLSDNGRETTPPRPPLALSRHAWYTGQCRCLETD